MKINIFVFHKFDIQQSYFFLNQLRKMFEILLTSLIYNILLIKLLYIFDS